MEQFKTLPGYEGRFEVSLNGTVRTAPYTDAAGRQRKSRIIRPQPSKHGHLMVRLCYNGSVLTTYVHRLMLSAWVRPPRPGEYACHRNDVPDDNRLENLYWGTPADNTRDSVRNKGHRESKKTHCKHGHPLSGDNVYTPPGKPTWRVCRECQKRARAEHYRRLRAGYYDQPNPDQQRRRKTHCKHGHEFTKENTYHPPYYPGRRICRTCAREASRRYSARRAS